MARTYSLIVTALGPGSGYSLSSNRPVTPNLDLEILSGTTVIASNYATATTSATGTASYPIANGHGDLVGETDAAGTFTAYPATDEFGVGDAPSSRLGWLGAHQRFGTGGTLRLIRMGVRLYDPTLGRFLAVDPVEGGTSNDYAYVDDPINDFDLTGEWGWKNIKRFMRAHWKKVAVGALLAGALVCTMSVACGAAVAVYGGSALMSAGGAAATLLVRLGRNPLAASNSNKVILQMSRGGYHSFPRSVEAFWRQGRYQMVRGGDEKLALKFRIAGSYGGRDGHFTFMKRGGQINHRLFEF